MAQAPAVLTGLTEWLADRRNALLRSPKFQRWAAAFPLTRPITRHRVRDLFELCTGFVYSQILLACVQLDIFERVADAPLTAEALAVDSPLTSDQMAKLADAAVALDLLERRSGGRYGLGQAGAALLGSPGISAMVRHHALLYEDLVDPIALLQRDGGGGKLQDYWAYARSESPDNTSSEAVSEYTDLMARSQSFIADLVLDAYDVSQHTAMTDMGGGAGVFAEQAAQRAPQLKAKVFDLPAVAGVAEARFKDLAISDRLAARGGSFFDGPLPPSADLISLVRILHDHDDGPAQIILERAFSALEPNGTLLIAEPMARTKGAEPAGDAYFGFYLLAMGSGRPRSRTELEAMMSAAGFADISEHRTHTPLLVRVLTARKP